jgi:hypothetical protein
MLGREQTEIVALYRKFHTFPEQCHCVDAGVGRFEMFGEWAEGLNGFVNGF